MRRTFTSYILRDSQEFHLHPKSPESIATVPREIKPWKVCVARNSRAQRRFDIGRPDLVVKLRTFLQLGKHQPGDFAERFENALAGNRHAFHNGLAFLLQLLGKLGNGHGIRQIALI